MVTLDPSKTEVTPVSTFAPWQKILLLFVASRLIVVLGFLLSTNTAIVRFCIWVHQLFFNAPNPAGRIYALHPFFYSSGWPTLSDIGNAWDGFWYLKIATEGYSYDGTTLHQTVVHYPFFAWMTQTLALLPMALGMPQTEAIILTGIILNNGLFFLSLVLLYKIISKYAPTTLAWSVITLLALYPGSMFCSLYLTEAPFLAFSLAAFYAMECNRYWLAALLTWPASLTRYNGAILGVPLLQKIGLQNVLRPQGFLPLLVVALGAAIYPLYQWWAFGDPLIYFKLQSLYRGQLPLIKILVLLLPLLALMLFHWMRPQGFKITWLPDTFIRKVKVICLVWFCGFFFLGSFLHFLGLQHLLGNLQAMHPMYETPGAPASLFAVLLFVFYQHRLPREYQVYTLLNLLAILMANNFLSNHRYLVMLFPIFWCLGIALAHYPKLQKAFYGTFACLLFVLTVLYFGTGWFLLF